MPPKRRSSVSTLMTRGAAGLVVGGERGRVVDRARASPLDGLLRLTSAMTRDAVVAAQRGDAVACRRGGRRRAALSSSSGTRAWRAARSARTPTRISSSTLTLQSLGR